MVLAARGLGRRGDWGEVEVGVAHVSWAGNLDARPLLLLLLLPVMEELVLDGRPPGVVVRSQEPLSAVVLGVLLSLEELGKAALLWKLVALGDLGGVVVCQDVGQARDGVDLKKLVEVESSLLTNSSRRRRSSFMLLLLLALLLQSVVLLLLLRLLRLLLVPVLLQVDGVPLLLRRVLEAPQLHHLSRLHVHGHPLRLRLASLRPAVVPAPVVPSAAAAAAQPLISQVPLPLLHVSPVVAPPPSIPVVAPAVALVVPAVPLPGAVPGPGWPPAAVVPVVLLVSVVPVSAAEASSSFTVPEAIVAVELSSPVPAVVVVPVGATQDPAGPDPASAAAAAPVRRVPVPVVPAAATTAGRG